ncbi:transmembrane and TPR repeat-containing protein 4 isoform X2 [Cephus cinctus]|uniref:dolichyl-phosphate-mannose--protein mannosyltransferase n=1 Tax=Cephus cinctus TaxID=211228 RepID=A0AAJ7CAE9_CEPCN|nr:transmembrane and TPR repeat-containing protein 4 isoform X2 [Cephus cinctus]
MKSEQETRLPVVRLPVALTTIVLLSLCFLNSYNGDFVFDDTEAIVNNDDVKDTLILDIFKHDFWGTKLIHKQSHKSYRPLTILTFRAQYWIRGYLNPHDFHIVNIILHIIVCILTFFVFDILLGSKAHSIAFYAAALFSVHPIHTEAVSGIVGRADVICALFFWLSIIFYSKNINARGTYLKWSSMCGCILCIGIAMLCKETGITAIGICAIYDIIIVNKLYPMDIIRICQLKDSFRPMKQLVNSKYKLCIRLIILCISTMMLLMLRFSIMGFSTPKFQPVDNPTSFMDSFILRVLNYNYIYSLNTWLILCPEWLCFDWSMGCIPTIEGYDFRILNIIILWSVLSIFLTNILTANNDSYLRCTIMGLALLIVPFLPASNIFFNVGFVLAERTLYIPSAGYCLLFATGLEKLYGHVSWRKTLLSLYIGLIAIFFVRSWIRSYEWKTETELFRAALDVCPLNAKVHYNIAKNAADLGNATYAEEEYKEALRLNPNYAQAMNNLGNLLKDRKEFVEAEKLFKRAVELQDDFAAAWMNLGIVLSALGKYQEAERSYTIGLTHRTKFPDCYYNLGVLYLEQKRYAEALKAWGNATRQKNTHRRAWTNTILLLDQLGLQEKALVAATEALKLIPDDASIYFNMANILGKAGKFVEAEKYFNGAISRDANNPTFYTNLGINKFISYTSSITDIYNLINISGVLYHRWKMYDKAENMYRKALEINPGLRSARDNLKRLKKF